MATHSRKHTRIVAADAHPLVLNGIQGRLDRTPDLRVVATAAQYEDLDQAIVEHAPDLLLLDLEFDFGRDPIQAIDELRRVYPGLKIVVLSALDEPRWVVGTLRSGIDGYVHKREPPDVLEQAIRQVADGKAWFSQRLLNVLAREFQQSTELGSHERMVIQTLADGKDLRSLTGRLGVSYRTLRRYLADAMEKLGAQTRGEAVANAFRQGLIE